MEFLLTLDVAPLHAAAVVATYTKNAKQKPNEVMHGVNLSRSPSGAWTVAALDNAMVFAGRVYPEDVHHELEALDITIPASVIARLPKKGSVDLFEVEDSDNYMLEDVLFTPLAGAFPPWRKLIPGEDNLEDPGKEHLPLPASETVAGFKALAMYHGIGANSPSLLRRVLLRGRKPAVLVCSDTVENPPALVLVQPDKSSAVDPAGYAAPDWT